VAFATSATWLIRHYREIKSTCARIRSILGIRYNSPPSACTPNFKCLSFTCSTLRPNALYRALNHRIAHCIIQIDQRRTSDRKQKCYHFCTCAIKYIKTEVNFSRLFRYICIVEIVVVELNTVSGFFTASPRIANKFELPCMKSTSDRENLNIFVTVSPRHKFMALYTLCSF